MISVILTYLIINILFISYDRWYFIIKLPPKNGMINGKEPLYKMQWAQEVRPWHYTVVKYEKTWDDTYYDYKGNLLISILFLMIFFTRPFFLKFNTYKYRETGRSPIPKSKDENPRESLMRFKGEIGQYYEDYTKKWNDKWNADCKKDNDKKIIKNEKIKEFNKDFNRHYIS